MQIISLHFAPATLHQKQKKKLSVLLQDGTVRNRDEKLAISTHYLSQ